MSKTKRKDKKYIKSMKKESRKKRKERRKQKKRRERTMKRQKLENNKNLDFINKLGMGDNIESSKSEFKKLKCGASRLSGKKQQTCYLDDELKELKRLWNLRHPDVLIKDDDSYNIWLQLKNNMSSICNEESCWLKQKFSEKSNFDKAKLLNYAFAPKSPEKWKKNINEWLSSVDIEKVMKQWEQRVPSFIFLGPSPIDFDDTLNNGCVWPDLCGFNLKKHIQNEKNKIGIIFNLDKHYQDGSHWVSLFINVSKGFICYFDSNGSRCPGRIMELVKRIKKQGKQLNYDFRFIQNNPQQHQKHNTECGMYSLFFTINMLSEHKEPEYFKEHSIPDKDMEKYRPVYFNI